jgi:hypothetical protein
LRLVSIGGRKEVERKEGKMVEKRKCNKINTKEKLLLQLLLHIKINERKMKIKRKINYLLEAFFVFTIE